MLVAFQAGRLCIGACRFAQLGERSGCPHNISGYRYSMASRDALRWASPKSARKPTIYRDVWGGGLISISTELSARGPATQSAPPHTAIAHIANLRILVYLLLCWPTSATHHMGPHLGIGLPVLPTARNVTGNTVWGQRSLVCSNLCKTTCVVFVISLIPHTHHCHFVTLTRHPFPHALYPSTSPMHCFTTILSLPPTLYHDCSAIPH